MRIGWVIPTVGCFGSVREMVEVSNVLVERGHTVTIYTPAGSPCTWLPCSASYGKTRDVAGARLDVVIGITDWQPDLYDVVVHSGAAVKAITLMGFPPTEEMARMLRGEVPIPDLSTQMFKRALDNPKLHILADGAWQLDWVRGVLGREVGVAFGGVNTDMFHPRVGPRRRGSYRLGASGDPRTRKGSSTVMEAVALLRKRWKFEFSTYYGKRYTQDELVAWYQDRDIFLDGHYRGGWCNPVVEAMACGCAVVCTNIGATSAVAGDGKTARLVSPGDADGMAAMVSWLLEDEKRIEQLRKNGIAAAQRYAYRRVVPALEGYLLQHLERG